MWRNLAARAEGALDGWRVGQVLFVAVISGLLWLNTGRQATIFPKASFAPDFPLPPPYLALSFLKGQNLRSTAPTFGRCETTPPKKSRTHAPPLVTQLRLVALVATLRARGYAYYTVVRTLGVESLCPTASFACFWRSCAAARRPPPSPSRPAEPYVLPAGQCEGCTVSKNAAGCT